MDEGAETQTVLIRFENGEVPNSLVDIIQGAATAAMRVNFSREDDGLTIHVDLEDPEPLMKKLNAAGFETRLVKLPPVPAVLLGHHSSVDTAILQLAASGIQLAVSESGATRQANQLTEKQIEAYIKQAATDPCVQVRAGVVMNDDEHTESISWDFTPDDPDGSTFPPALKEFKKKLREDADKEIKEAEEGMADCPSQCPNKTVIKIARPPRVLVRGPLKKVWFAGYYYWWGMTGQLRWTVIKICT